MNQAKHYHVTLKNIQHAPSVLEWITNVGGTDLEQWSAFPTIIGVSLENGLNDAVALHEGVLSVEEDRTYAHAGHRTLDLTYNWGLDRVGHRTPQARNAFASLGDGTGVDIYVVDSGVLCDTVDAGGAFVGGHQEFQGRCNQKLSWDAYRDAEDSHYGMPGEREYTVACPDGSPRCWALDDSGTHVASLAAGSSVGVAPGATLIPVRVFDRGATTDRVLLNAAQWMIAQRATRQRPSVANMSFSAFGASSVNSMVVQALVANGFIVVASAGNDSQDASYFSPAGVGVTRNRVVQPDGRYTFEYTVDSSFKPIVVGASERPASTNSLQEGGDRVSSTSNWGHAVDLFAPGANILGAGLFTIGASPCDVDYAVVDQYSVRSGTSASAPLVAGICAVYLQAQPQLTQAAMRGLLIDRATRGVLSGGSLQHTRSAPQMSNGVVQWRTLGETECANVISESADRLAYVWDQATRLAFISEDSAFDLTVGELTQGTVQFEAASRSEPFGELQGITYRLAPVGAVAVPTWVSLRQEVHRSDVPGEDARVTAVLSYDAPQVDDDLGAPAVFSLVVTDGRQELVHLISIRVLNVARAPLWSDPPFGDLTERLFGNSKLNTGMSITPGNRAQAVFLAKDPDRFPDNTAVTYSLLPGPQALPPGLELVPGDVPGTVELRGTVGILPKVLPEYRFVVRASKPGGLISDRTFAFGNPVSSNLPHQFVKPWLTSLALSDRKATPVVDACADDGDINIYQLDTQSIGSNSQVQISLENPDLDDLIPVVRPVPGIQDDVGIFNGRLPVGISINGRGLMQGIVQSNNFEGKYFFRLLLADAYDKLTQTYHNPVCRNFFIEVRGSTGVDSTGSRDNVLWETESGNIGHIWETYPSHVGVSAKSIAGNKVVYTLVSGTLPSGIQLDSPTGFFKGNAPNVTSDSTYNVIVRASSGLVYSDRRFDFVVRNLYNIETTTGVHGQITGDFRTEIGSWTWISSRIPQDIIFRHGDPAFGRVREPFVYMVDGLNILEGDLNSQYRALLAQLRDYHQPTDIRLGKIRSAVVRDPSGRHVYDVVYFDVVDPMAGAGGFDRDGKEFAVKLADSTKALPRIRSMNLAAGTRQFFPNSLRNMRLDLIQAADRVNRQGILEPYPVDFVESRGLAGAEGMPMWMQTEQSKGKPATVIGWCPAVVVAYLLPGRGKAAEVALQIAGTDKQLSGRKFTLDRYLIQQSSAQQTTFDVGLTYTFVDSTGFTNVSTGMESTFDSDPKQIVWDLGSGKTNKYYKFPPGDK